MKDREARHLQGPEADPGQTDSEPEGPEGQMDDPVQETQRELESWRRYLLVPSLGAGPIFADEQENAQPEKDNPSGFDLDPLDAGPGSATGGDGTGLE